MTPSDKYGPVLLEVFRALDRISGNCSDLSEAVRLGQLLNKSGFELTLAPARISDLEGAPNSTGPSMTVEMDSIVLAAPFEGFDQLEKQRRRRQVMALPPQKLAIVEIEAPPYSVRGRMQLPAGVSVSSVASLTERSFSHRSLRRFFPVTQATVRLGTATVLEPSTVFVNRDSVGRLSALPIGWTSNLSLSEQFAGHNDR